MFKNILPKGVYNMVEKVNGVVKSGTAQMRPINQFKIRTTLDITPSATADINAASQKRLDALINVFGLRAQAVRVGAIVKTTEAVSSVTDIPAVSGQSGNVDIYSVVLENYGDLVWSVDSLSSSLNGVEGFVSTIPTDGNNFSIVRKRNNEL